MILSANLFPPISALQRQLPTLLWRVPAWQIKHYFNCFLAFSEDFNLLGLCMTGLVILLTETVYLFPKFYGNRLLRNSYGSHTEYSHSKSSQIPEFSPQHHSTAFGEHPSRRVIRRHLQSSKLNIID